MKPVTIKPINRISVFFCILFCGAFSEPCFYWVQGIFSAISLYQLRIADFENLTDWLEATGIRSCICGFRLDQRWFQHLQSVHQNMLKTLQLTGHNWPQPRSPQEDIAWSSHPSCLDVCPFRELFFIVSVFSVVPRTPQMERTFLACCQGLGSREHPHVVRNGAVQTMTIKSLMIGFGRIYLVYPKSTENEAEITTRNVPQSPPNLCLCSCWGKRPLHCWFLGAFGRVSMVSLESQQKRKTQLRGMGVWFPYQMWWIIIVLMCFYALVVSDVLCPLKIASWQHRCGSLGVHWTQSEDDQYLVIRSFLNVVWVMKVG